MSPFRSLGPPASWLKGRAAVSARREKAVDVRRRTILEWLEGRTLLSASGGPKGHYDVASPSGKDPGGPARDQHQGDQGSDGNSGDAAAAQSQGAQGGGQGAGNAQGNGAGAQNPGQDPSGVPKGPAANVNSDGPGASQAPPGQAKGGGPQDAPGNAPTGPVAVGPQADGHGHDNGKGNGGEDSSSGNGALGAHSATSAASGARPQANGNLQRGNRGSSGPNSSDGAGSSTGDLLGSGSSVGQAASTVTAGTGSGSPSSSSLGEAGTGESTAIAVSSAASATNGAPRDGMPSSAVATLSSAAASRDGADGPALAGNAPLGDHGVAYASAAPVPTPSGQLAFFASPGSGTLFGQGLGNSSQLKKFPGWGDGGGTPRERGQHGDTDPNGQFARAGLGHPSQVGADAQETPSVEGPLPLSTEILTTVGPFNLEAWEQAVQEYFDEVEDLGNAVADILLGEDLSLWLISAAVLVAGGEIARRRTRSSNNAPAVTGFQVA